MGSVGKVGSPPSESQVQSPALTLNLPLPLPESIRSTRTLLLSRMEGALQPEGRRSLPWAGSAWGNGCESNT